VTAWAGYHLIEVTAWTGYHLIEVTAWAGYHLIEVTAWAGYHLIEVTAWAGFTVQFIWYLLWQDKKKWPFNIGEWLLNRGDHMSRFNCTIEGCTPFWKYEFQQ
jgi:hypothetical protein